jgi:hypothetical protein
LRNFPFSEEAVEEQVRAAPKIEQSKRIRVHALVSSSASVVPRLAQNPISGDVSHGAADKADNAGLNQLEITARPELPPKGTPEIFVSFAWGDDSSEDARTEVVDRLCETLGQHGWHILRDSNVLRSGAIWSRASWKRIGPADHVIVVLSDKYLRSPYCMTELHYIYQRSLGEKEDFLRRIIPLVLADARSAPGVRVLVQERQRVIATIPHLRVRHFFVGDYQVQPRRAVWIRMTSFAIRQTQALWWLRLGGAEKNYYSFYLPYDQTK